MEYMSLAINSPEPFGFLYSMSLWAAIFFILGFIFIIIEMFNPGFGVPGITGTILLFIGVIMTARSALDVLIMLLIILAILGLSLTLVLYSATRGRLSKTLILNDSLDKEQGFESSEDLDYFLGKEGIATTVLRPAGTADFDGVKLDVVARGENNKKGVIIKVI